MIELAAGGASDVGRVRSANEDSFVITEDLWAVADGMGGHQGGEVASQLAVGILESELEEPTAAALLQAAERANAAVHKRAEVYPELRGMGTTLCALARVRDADDHESLAIINIGDSRCYVFHDGELSQITRDHSLVEDMRAAGQITDAEAAVHPHRNIVTRALGIQSEVRVDEFDVVPSTGDRYVICSDGLFNEVSADRISATLRRLADPQDAASELIRQANEAGGRDNVTCVVVDVLDDDGAADRAGATAVPTIRSHSRPPDVAGITTAQPVIDDDEPPGASDRTEADTDANGTRTRPRLRRATWRTLIFSLVVLAVLAIAAAAVGWYARGSYFIGYDNGEVTIFKGRPQSVLWFDPTVAEHTGIAKAQVPAVFRDDLAAGKQQSSVSDAHGFLTRMRSVICSNLRNGATSPKAPPGAPTTTIPAACRNDASITSATSTTTTSTTTTPGGATTTTLRGATTTTSP